jgi:CRISPR-associated protein Csx10
MGSVFVYDQKQFAIDELEVFINQGIGERCVDGFGRIAVNWHDGARFCVQNPVYPKTLPFTLLSPESRKLAHTMSRRMLFKRLDAILLSKSQEYTIKGEINNHQLSRFRNILRSSIHQGKGDMEVSKDFLSDLKPTARKQFEHTRVIQADQAGGPRLWEWLQERIDKKDGLTEVGFNETMIPEVAGQKHTPSSVIEAEYTLRLIEALIDSKMKLNRKEGKS